MNDLNLRKPRDIGDLLKDTFQYLRIHYKSLGIAIIIFVLPLYLISGILVGEGYRNFFSAVFDNPELTPDFGLGLQFWMGFLLLGIAYSAMVIITLRHMKIVLLGEEPDTSSLLSGFGVYLFYLILLYLIVVFGVGLGLLFFIIPGIYLGIRFFVSPAVIIFENENPIEAIGRSWNLSRGHWWTTFGLYLIFNILTSMMSYILIIPFMIIVQLLSSAGIMGMNINDSSLGSIMYTFLLIVSSLFSVILLVAMGLHYLNLQERKDGSSLSEEIDELA